MYSFFYKLLPAKNKIADSDVHLLNENEIKSIKKTETAAILSSALIGSIMVVILFLPQYKLNHIFSNKVYEVPLLHNKFEFSIISTIYGFLLVITEVIFLTLLNIYCIHNIALSTGFINKHNKLVKEKREFILNISHNKKNKEILKFGIDPYWGLKKSTIFFLNLLFSLKATLSNYLIRTLFKRILGRFATRIVLDFMGIPVFAFWNALGTAKILKESRIIIMGINYLKILEIELSKFRALSEKEKTILYDSLQYIAISKRDYHQNHYALSKIVVEIFSIPIETTHQISDDYEIKLQSCESDFKNLNEKILILGIVIDGSVSIREQTRIKKLCKTGVLSLQLNEIKKISKDFAYGKGIEFKKN